MGSGQEPSEGVRNAPAILSVVLYTASAAVSCMSSFKAVHIPSMTKGKASIHKFGCVFRAPIY